MKSTPSTLAMAGAAAVLALVPGAALAQSHSLAEPHAHDESHRQIIHGIVSGGMTGVFSLGALHFLRIATAQGKTVAVTLTPQTHIDMEAQGTDAALFSGKAQIVVSAVVTEQHGTLVGTEVDARVMANPAVSKARKLAMPRPAAKIPGSPDPARH